MRLKTKAGGKRKGAGRKPLPFAEKKTALKLYLKNEVVENLGGADKLIEKISVYVEELNSDRRR